MVAICLASVCLAVLQEDDGLVERAVDCLRILTAGHDANKVAVLAIPAALPALVRLLSRPDAMTSVRPKAPCCSQLLSCARA